MAGTSPAMTERDTQGLFIVGSSTRHQYDCRIQRLTSFSSSVMKTMISTR